MSLVSFKDLMADASRGHYAIGYFESWNMESLLAVADAAEATRSPIILGFSGIQLADPARAVRDRLSPFAALGLDVCRQISVPACLLFNECPDVDMVEESIDRGFGLVMFSDESLGFEEQLEHVRSITAHAHQASVAVEAEMSALPGISGELSSMPEDVHLTDPKLAREFVERTGIDALAVNVGQVHLHGRRKVHLDQSRLSELREAVPVPLVLHGASSTCREDLVEAIRRGVRKINVGSVLRMSCFEAMRRACAEAGEDYNPYEVIGSGLKSDVLVAGRVALQKVVEDMMRLFGSADRV